MGTPAAEIEIDVRQARQLLAAQHPDLAGLSIVAIASGWDNQLLRLGDSLALRFPRRQFAAQLILHEQRWRRRTTPRPPGFTAICTRATWRRARGWALLFAVILLGAGLVDDARMTAIAERTIARLWEGP
jgi:hypothetical protein